MSKALRIGNRSINDSGAITGAIFVPDSKETATWANIVSFYIVQHHEYQINSVQFDSNRFESN